LRVFAVETVFKSKINEPVIIDSEIFTQETLHKYLALIKVKNLCTYKEVNIKKVMNFRKRDSYSLVLSIKDRIVQTLFVQLIEPIIDVRADKHSFGYRERRNVSQALSQLSGILNQKLVRNRKTGNMLNFSMDYNTSNKYLLKVDLKGFFQKDNHN